MASGSTVAVQSAVCPIGTGFGVQTTDKFVCAVPGVTVTGEVVWEGKRLLSPL